MTQENSHENLPECLMAMHCWDETCTGQEFPMSPIEVHFMAHENLVIKLPLPSNMARGCAHQSHMAIYNQKSITL